jgi:hypothetical protein
MAAEAAMGECFAEWAPPYCTHTPQEIPDRSCGTYCSFMMKIIYLLQSEIASSRTAEAQLQEDILELRAIISVFDAFVF